MISRRRTHERINSLVDLTSVPEPLQEPLTEFLTILSWNVIWTPTGLLRELRKHPELEGLFCLTNEQLGRIFKCSPTVVHRVKNESPAPEPVPKKVGRPTVLLAEEEAEIIQWIIARTRERRWVSQSELKQRVVQFLEDRNAQEYPSRQFYRDFVERAFRGEFTTKVAETLDNLRAEVSTDDLQRYFDELVRLDVSDVNPRLLMNIDETGFGQSKSGRLKSTKVLVPKSVTGRLAVGRPSESHFVSAICTITASGECLAPGLVIKRKTVPVGVDTLPIGENIKIYSAEKAFVTRRIFQAYLAETVVPYVDAVRRDLGDDHARAMILWDGHPSHFDQLTAAYAAQHGVTLVAIPPHASHLVQPLDRQFFKKVKQLYSFYTPRSDLEKITATILRVVQSIQSASSMSVIVGSWQMAGLRPVIENREVVRVEVDSRRVLYEDEGQEDCLAPRGRATRPTDNPNFGVLNEDEQMFLEGGLCPFCMAPLHAEEEDKTLD